MGLVKILAAGVAEFGTVSDKLQSAAHVQDEDTAGNDGSGPEIQRGLSI